MEFGCVRAVAEPHARNLTARAELLYRKPVEELREMLRCRGLQTAGLKGDLVERLLQTGAAGSDAQAGYASRLLRRRAGCEGQQARISPMEGRCRLG